MPGDVPAYRQFLQVHLVWHPDFNHGVTGLELVEQLYREFCRDPDKLMATAIGVPMLFYSSVAGAVPPQIDLERARHNIVVLLVDDEMVLDPLFNAYAEDVAARASRDRNRHLVLAFNWTSARLDLGNTQQIALGLGTDPITRLRLTFAAEACRLLRAQPRVDSHGVAIAPAPPRLFISHAKRDAEDKALEIKALVEKTSVDTFFDRVDIAAGFDFTDEIRNNIKQAAVLAWQSDEYAARPWCNIELLTAKEHQRPIVVVLGVKAGEERSFPYLGNVRTIVATETNSAEIIIAAVREYLRKLYADGHFKTLVDAGLGPRARFHLFRPPEPIDGALLERRVERVREARQATNEQPGPMEPAIVMYPDPPSSSIEIDVLQRLFPDLTFITPSTADGRSLKSLIVGLSISESEDVAAAGLSRLHLQAAMVEIARHVLTRGATLAYGGDLRPRAQYGITRQLLEIVHAYKDLERPPLERIRNYLAHHVDADLPRAEEAALLKLARFVKPASPTLSARFGLQPKARVPDDTPERRYVRARALTVMREAMANDTHARIFIGGRISGHQGKYPGILEEAALSLGRQPIFCIAAFGGCTRLLVQALRDKVRPPELTNAFQRTTTRMATWQDDRGTRHEESVPGAQLMEAYQAFAGQDVDDGPIDYDAIVERFIDADTATLNNGLAEEENHELFETTDLDRIIALVIKGLRSISECS
jgi:hypothetical protein